jgi:hypothetical protein
LFDFIFFGGGIEVFPFMLCLVWGENFEGEMLSGADLKGVKKD